MSYPGCIIRPTDLLLVVGQVGIAHLAVETLQYVSLHLNSSNHSFEKEDVIVLDREFRWFERGVKEAIYIYIKSQQPSLNKEGDLRHILVGAYSSAIKKQGGQDTFA